ncbi:MAG: hypothetical protein HGA78_08095, partial [Nitrospirales bacterium]|nr:hypothetical protein [Nitrospirales bacterium]
DKENRPRSVAGQAILGSKEFIDRVVETIEKGNELPEVTAKRFYRKGIELEALYQAVCLHYRIKGITKGREGGHSRDMFVYLAKRQTNATNSEIGQKAGGITFSAVAQQYARTMRRLEQDQKEMDEWLSEEKGVLSNVKG